MVVACDGGGGHHCCHDVEVGGVKGRSHDFISHNQKPTVMGTGLTDTGTGMALGTEKFICTHTRGTLTRVPTGYICTHVQH